MHYFFKMLAINRYAVAAEFEGHSRWWEYTIFLLAFRSNCGSISHRFRATYWFKIANFFTPRVGGDPVKIIGA